MIAAGSLPGTLLAKPKSYPVGMVNLLDLYPLNFDEFLAAVDPPLYAYYKSIVKEQTIEEIFHNRLPEAYSTYLIIGGMPECAASWIKYRDPAKVSQIQRELIEIYERDTYPIISRSTQSVFQNAGTERTDGSPTSRCTLRGKRRSFCNVHVCKEWNKKSRKPFCDFLLHGMGRSKPL